MHVFGERARFLKWAVVNAAYIVALVAGRVLYHGHIHSIGLLAICAVLALWAVASGWAGWLCWEDRRRGVHHVSLAIELAPKLAMLGTVGGFLIAFSAGSSDVQQRVLGASTGLAATFVGIATMVVLEIQRHLVEDD